MGGLVRKEKQIELVPHTDWDWMDIHLIVIIKNEGGFLPTPNCTPKLKS